jgi:thymidylate kinase
MRPRIAVALSGVDGSGKSTVARCLRDDLERAGVPVGAVWARPGLHLGALTRLSRRIKPLLGQAPGPGVRTVARGNGSRLPSRRGLVGWIWSLLVTLAFLADVWRQHLAAQGVVLYDRHVTDAVVTLDVLYSGPDLRVQRALARRLMPRTTLTAYLTIDPETAAGRKPGDMIGLQAIRAQLDRYETEVAGLERLLRLDGLMPPQYNAREIVERLLALA